MTYNQYRMIFYVSFTAFAIMLIASIVILIVLEIPKVIGALTGKSARKGIAAIVQKQTAEDIGNFSLTMRVNDYIRLVSPEICVQGDDATKLFEGSVYLDGILLQYSTIYLSNVIRCSKYTTAYIITNSITIYIVIFKIIKLAIIYFTTYKWRIV